MGRANVIYSYITFIVSLAFRAQYRTIRRPSARCTRHEADADIITIVRTLLPPGRVRPARYRGTYNTQVHIPGPSRGVGVCVVCMCDIFRAPPGLPATQSCRRRRFIYSTGTFWREGGGTRVFFCPFTLSAVGVFSVSLLLSPCVFGRIVFAQSGGPSLAALGHAVFQLPLDLPLWTLCVHIHRKRPGRRRGVRLRRTIRARICPYACDLRLTMDRL